MKKTLAVFLSLSLAVTLAACSAPKTDNGNNTDKQGEGVPINLVTAHNQTAVDNQYQIGLLKFKEEIEKTSNGAIVTEVHNGTIGTNESELIEKLTIGAADMVVASPGFMAQMGIKELDLLAMPYLFSDIENWLLAIDGEFGNTIKTVVAEKSDFKIMDIWSTGIRSYYGKKPINTPEDLKGMKIRTQSSEVQKNFWIATGAIPTSVDWNELYQALQQNTVDAAENDYTSLMQKDHHKTPNGKYISETEHDISSPMLVMSTKKFNTYTQEQQEWITAAARVATEEERAYCIGRLASSKEKVIADGATVNAVDKTPFIAIAVPQQDKFAEDNGFTELLSMARSAK